MTQQVDPELVTLIRETLQGATSLMEASRRLRGDNKDLRTSPAFPVMWAFEYDFVEVDEVDRRASYGPWAPWFESHEGVFPPPLDSVEESTLALWAELASELSDLPLAVARLEDLLWERKWDRPHLRAQSAIDANVLAAPTADDLEAAQFLVRALELSRTINDLDRERVVVNRIIEAARTSLARPEPQPGVALRLIESLLRLPADRRPVEINELLELALHVYGDDPHISQEVLELRASLTADLPSRQAIHEDQVRRWRSAADRATGLVRLTFLQRALDLARLHGLADVADEIRLEIQGTSPDELDLKTVSSSVQIPEEEVEAYIESFLTDTWQGSLDRIGAVGPPSGDHDANTEQIEQNMRNFPLQFLVSKVVLGPENVPIRVIQGGDEHREAALIEQEALGIAIGAQFRAEALDRIRDRFGVPTHDELMEFFTTDVIAEHIAERLARALELFWEGQFDESSLVVLPRIEAAVRSLVRGMGLVVVVEAQGVRPGRVKMLRELLGALEGRYLSESWRRYLVNALVEPLGTNLRNTLLHGLSAQADRNEAAILLQIACHLRLARLVVEPADHGDEARGDTLTP